MTRSYSRPICPRTFSMAERIFRAFSSLLKSVSGSLTKGPSWRRIWGRVGASTVAIRAPQEEIRSGARSAAELLIVALENGSEPAGRRRYQTLIGNAHVPGRLGNLERIVALGGPIAHSGGALQFVPGEALALDGTLQRLQQNY